MQQVYASYGRYYGESFRLPSISPRELAARMSYEGYEHVDRRARQGHRPLAVPPAPRRLGVGAYWLTRVRKLPVTAVVEPLEPPALFDWFVGFRERIGMHIVPLGPEAGRATVAAVKEGHVVCPALRSRHRRGGVEVEFFGERTTLPAGPGHPRPPHGGAAAARPRSTSRAGTTTA